LTLWALLAFRAIFGLIFTALAVEEDGDKSGLKVQ